MYLKEIINELASKDADLNVYRKEAWCIASPIYGGSFYADLPLSEIVSIKNTEFFMLKLEADSLEVGVDYYIEGGAQIGLRKEENGILQGWETPVVKSYSFKHYFPFRGNGRLYGVELEMNVSEGIYGDRDLSGRKFLSNFEKNYCHLKHDGSIGDGFEVVTTACSYEEHVRVIKTLSDVVSKDSGIYCDVDTCGMHVHVSRRSMSKLTVCKLNRFFNEPLHGPFISYLAGREISTESRWCRINKNHRDGAQRGSDRYVAFNLCNENTVEFRIFEGSIDSYRILQNLEYVKSLIEWAENNSIRKIYPTHFREWVKERKHLYPKVYSFNKEYVEKVEDYVEEVEDSVEAEAPRILSGIRASLPQIDALPSNIETIIHYSQEGEFISEWSRGEDMPVNTLLCRIRSNSRFVAVDYDYTRFTLEWNGREWVLPTAETSENTPTLPGNVHYGQATPVEFELYLQGHPQIRWPVGECPPDEAFILARNQNTCLTGISACGNHRYILRVGSQFIMVDDVRHTPSGRMIPILPAGLATLTLGSVIINHSLSESELFSLDNWSYSNLRLRFRDVEYVIDNIEDLPYFRVIPYITE